MSKPAATSRKSRQPTLGVRLRARGFDRTVYDRRSGYYRVGCSQCQALVINGLATHERGCPNESRADEDADE